MQTTSNHTHGRPHVKLFAMLLAAAFMVTAVAIAPAGAQYHHQDDEGEGHGNDGHHKQKKHPKHWNEYGRHVYYPPPPVVYAAPPEYYAPPPPVVYSPAPSITFIIPIH